MVELTALWLPILVSAAIVFFASAIIWMASPLHKHDYKDPGDKQEAIVGMLRGGAFEPGVYYVPWCKGKDRKDPAFQAAMNAGPWAQLIVMPGKPNMGRSLGLWFVHLLMVGVFVAYLSSHALAPGAHYLKVFQAAGCAALLAHAGYALPLCIWHGQPWSQLPGRIVDGVIYALLTAGAFGWLWPKAASILPVH